MASFIPNNLLLLLLNGGIDLDTDDLRMSLHGSTCDVDDEDDEDDQLGDITTLGELSGTGYVAGHGNAGRQALDSLAATVDDPSDEAELDCADEPWTGLDCGTIDFIILHKKGASDDSTAEIIAVYDVSQVTNGGDITVQINAEGLLKLGRV